MECTNCGNIMEEGTVICEVCGASNETVEFNKIKDNANDNGNRVAIVKRRKNNPPPMSLMQYLYMLLVMCIPIFGIVMTFLWAFNKKDNPNRTNLARAMLIVWAVLLVIFIILSIVAGSFIGEFVKNYFSMF